MFTTLRRKEQPDNREVTKLNLTPIKMEILQTFKQYQVQKHYSPTMKELAELLGKSRTTVFEHCAALREKGYLTPGSNKARSFKLTDLAERAVSSASEPEETAYEEREGGIPMLGSIAAGFPVEPMDVEDRLSIESEFNSRGPVFALRVSGESMIDDNIFPGDFVICRQSSEARNGDVVVAIVDDNEATLKRFYKEKDHIRLQPANERYAPIITRNCLIKGVVVGLIRKM